MLGRHLLRKMLAMPPEELDVQASRENAKQGVLQFKLPMEQVIDDTLKDVVSELSERQMADKVGQYYINLMGKYVAYFHFQKIIDFRKHITSEGYQYIDSCYDAPLCYAMRTEGKYITFSSSLNEWFSTSADLYQNAKLEYQD